jgi:predicted nucleic acid-binding protein
MAASVIVDASFLVTLLSRRESNHGWATEQAQRLPPPWKTCEAAVSEAFHLLAGPGASALAELLRRRALVCAFRFDESADETLALARKYADVPMSFADACLVRMTELLSGPIVLTTHADFRVYRRYGRKVIPAVMPGR